MLQRVQALVSALQADNTGAEAVMLYQDGQILFSHRFVPQKERLIYSHTKSFIATAAGMEGCKKVF